MSSENNRKRTEHVVMDQLQGQMLGQNQLVFSQPLILDPLVTNTEQVDVNSEQLQLPVNTPQNGQSNVIYLVLPPGVNQPQDIMQTISTLLFVPKNKEGEASSEVQQNLANFVVTNEKQLTENKKDEIIIPEKDPLELPESVNYNIMAQYGQLQPNNVHVLNSGNLQTFQPIVDTNPTRWKTQFKCEHCHISLPTLYAKKLHSDTHIYPSGTEFKCSICNMVFNQASDRNKHVDSHSVVNTYTCKICSKSFPYYISLVRHLSEKKCTVNKAFCCNYCGVQFINQDDIKMHLKINLKLCLCRTKFCSEQAFQLHKSICPAHKEQLGKKRRKQALSENDVIKID